MSNLENVSPAKRFLDNENQVNRRENSRRTDGVRRSGGLKLFVDSDKLNSDEARRIKKNRRNLLTFDKNSNDIRAKDLKLKRIYKKLENASGQGSQFSKQKLQPEKLHKISDARTSDFLEDYMVPLSSLITVKQSNQEPPKKNPEPIQKSSEMNDSSVSRKPSPNKSIEMKATTSEIKKKQINEILKGHAQKTTSTNSSKSCQQIAKDYCSGVNVLFGEPKIFVQTTSKEKVKKVESQSKSKSSENVELGERNDPDKKKLSKLMRVPASNELERRLKGSGSQQDTLYFQNKNSETQGKSKSTETAEEEEKKDEDVKAKETADKGEKKTEKKTTYTYKVLMSKIQPKPEKKKGLTETESKEVEKKEEIKIDKKSLNALQRADYRLQEIKNSRQQATFRVEPIPTDLVSFNIDIINLKEKISNEVIVKPKATRSSELRDLVNQAVKEHKIFCIFDNHWYIVRPVREELLNRGWLEVIPDRKLIPRRRPPPMGPTYDRERTLIDHTLEEILAAKESFVDEIQESVSSSLRSYPEKMKMAQVVPATKKISTDSLQEAISLFRIIPPTSEKKKNNLEIREFVAKCQQMEDKEREKDKILKGSKKLRELTFDEYKSQKSEMADKNNSLAVPSPLTKSLQIILNSLEDGRKSIEQSLSEIHKIDTKNNVNDLLDKVNLPLSVETTDSSDKKDKSQDKQVQKAQKLPFTENEAKIISKFIQSTNTKIQFMWLSIKPSIHLKCFNYSPEIVNKFQKTTFCTKIGLWNHLNNIQWYAHEVHFPAKSPRMYNTGEADDLHAFFQDFQLTACLGMLKWLADTFFEKGIKAVQTKRGKVPLKAFEFAIKQCEKYIRYKINEDLTMMEEPKALQEEWNTFLQWFYIITNDHGKVQESSSAQLMVVYTKAVETLRLMKKYWPEIDIDGRLNIWIVKPYCASCGRGIFMTNNVYYIGQHSKYIVQKYIERPFLIYNTKFDIRQWFMITKLTPLEIWMYKECYLRFCTQPFALRNLHESVHLSNNSVQRKYVGCRDPSLPDQNMWDSNTFQIYLKSIGYPTAWQDIIYPGMKDAIVSTMLAAQDTFDGPRRSWFEVYGADFMLSANLKEGPWLIEINENPAMDPSTKVTARLCPQMLRDVIKVVVDKKANKNASTGKWELVYRQNYSPSFASVDIDVKGRKIAKVPHSVKIELPPPQSSILSGKKNLMDNIDNKIYDVVKVLTTTTKMKKDGKEAKDSNGLTKEKTSPKRSAEKETNPKKPEQKNQLFIELKKRTNESTEQTKLAQEDAKDEKKEKEFDELKKKLKY